MLHHGIIVEMKSELFSFSETSTENPYCFVCHFPCPLILVQLHTHFNHLIGSQDLAFKSRPNPFTPAVYVHFLTVYKLDALHLQRCWWCVRVPPESRWGTGTDVPGAKFGVENDC
ncbi:hypothetical protein PR048_011974 [Dryococelus australis]|uniref:Uncharacterized protein n=1 Tax=Dryococelus australis TaxID=614101 RepID=A0ABQ9HNP7_9NEOP|nr:hypothetical protein PR048_011974 [Dryococelus australis]